jgi:pyruvate/2-oxoglutarate dehydrogenase complex dihydrolipoamide acyltransferase (E2) component
MLKDVIMPRMGDAATEGRVERWEKKVGDAVQMGELLAVVSVDKASYDLESPYDGRLAEVLAQPDAAVPVGTPIARIEVPA